MVGKNLKGLGLKGDYISSKDCNLKVQDEVIDLFSNKMYDRVIHCAARVGGLQSNMEKQYDYYYDNVIINSNVLEWARITGVARFTAVLSSCIFPKEVSLEQYPMTESLMHASPPAPTNYGYAIAKRAMAAAIDCVNEQYGLKYNYVIPCNMYGYYDKYGDNSHYIAALIKKIHQAKVNGDDHITLLGDGKSLRQFLFCEDFAKILMSCIEEDVTENINVACDELYTIHEMAEIALRACDAEHLSIRYEQPHLNGQFRKDIDNKKLKELFPDFKFTPLELGIRLTYKNYLEKLA